MNPYSMISNNLNQKRQTESLSPDKKNKSRKLTSKTVQDIEMVTRNRELVEPKSLQVSHDSGISKMVLD